MARLLLVVAVAVVVYLLIRSFRRNVPPKTDDAVAEDMVRCAYCGVHLPKGESVMSDGHFFCGVAHRDAYRK